MCMTINGLCNKLMGEKKRKKENYSKKKRKKQHNREINVTFSMQFFMGLCLWSNLDSKVYYSRSHSQHMVILHSHLYQ